MNAALAARAGFVNCPMNDCGLRPAWLKALAHQPAFAASLSQAMGSRGEAAGLRPRDVIVGAGKEPIDSPAVRAAPVLRLLSKNPPLSLAVGITHRPFRLTVGRRIRAQSVRGQPTIAGNFPLRRLAVVALAKAEFGPNSRCGTE